MLGTAQYIYIYIYIHTYSSKNEVIQRRQIAKCCRHRANQTVESTLTFSWCGNAFIYI